MCKGVSCSYAVCWLFAVQCTGKLGMGVQQGLAGTTVWSILGLSILMQEQANKDILPVKALEPTGRLLRLLLVRIHFTDYQLHRVLGQQVSPASQVSVIHVGAIAAAYVEGLGRSLYAEVCMLALSRLQLGCKLCHAGSVESQKLCGLLQAAACAFCCYNHKSLHCSTAGGRCIYGKVGSVVFCTMQLASASRVQQNQASPGDLCTTWTADP